MNFKFEGEPSFTFVHVDLAPGESFIAESDAMASMDADVDMVAKFNGGFFPGLLKKFLGGESLFVNAFTNNTSVNKRVTVTQPTPGDMMVKELNGESYCLQPGAYICSTPGIKLGVKWAGFASLIAREGLFKLVVSGHGTVIFGSYGAMVEKMVEGEYIVDTSHLVAYEPNMKLKIQLSGNLISSVTSGEGLVTLVKGSGKIVLQSRSMSGLASWINRHLF
jgi:uncharacterized protein (TIGR00266 family)